jgi:hypothetical protein
MRKVVAPEKKIFGYEFSHELRCGGSIVSFLGFEKREKLFRFLLRNEAVPC